MIIAGLGNPGSEYQGTRHNVGFLAVDILAIRFNCRLEDKAHRALRGTFNFKGDRHLLVKPLTYMNLSGEAVVPIVAEEQATAADLLVIVDDVNLPLGQWRLRAAGGHGGHNGLKSIIAGLGEQFWRLRIGVGAPRHGAPGSGPPPHEELVAHVLGPLDKDERGILERQFVELPEMVCMILAGMGQRAMGKFNGRCYEQDPSEEPSKPR